MDEHENDLAWQVELDRLDLDIMRIERLITAMKPMETNDWRVPALRGPLPERLLPRAMDIHERQSAALRAILRAMHLAQRQRRYVDRVAGEDQLGPRYLDITA